MWFAGITQGLMWRAYDTLGYLQYSFGETVEVLLPYYIIRAVGGGLFVVGALLMAYNLYMTARTAPAARRREAAASSAAAVPAE